MANNNTQYNDFQQDFRNHNGFDNMSTGEVLEAVSDHLSSSDCMEMCSDS